MKGILRICLPTFSLSIRPPVPPSVHLYQNWNSQVRPLGHLRTCLFGLKAHSLGGMAPSEDESCPFGFVLITCAKRQLQSFHENRSRLQYKIHGMLDTMTFNCFNNSVQVLGTATGHHRQGACVWSLVGRSRRRVSPQTAVLPPPHCCVSCQGGHTAQSRCVEQVGVLVLLTHTCPHMSARGRPRV